MILGFFKSLFRRKCFLSKLIFTVDPGGSAFSLKSSEGNYYTLYYSLCCSAIVGMCPLVNCCHGLNVFKKVLWGSNASRCIVSCHSVMISKKKVLETTERKSNFVLIRVRVRYGAGRNPAHNS